MAEDDIGAAIQRVSAAAEAALEAAKACQLPKTAKSAKTLAERAACMRDRPASVDVVRLRKLVQELHDQFLLNDCENTETG